MMSNEKEVIEAKEVEVGTYESLFEGYDLTKPRATFEWDAPVGKEV